MKNGNSDTPLLSEEKQLSVSTTDATISMLRANLIGIGFFPIVGVLFWLPYYFLWGEANIRNGFYSVLHPFPSLLILAFLIALHEVLHGIGYRYFGKVKLRNIKFGVQWKTITPFAHCAQPMNASAYRRSVILPLCALGILPSLAALMYGSSIIAIWSFLMIIAAGGDIAILMAVRRVPASTLVLDHPSRSGCLIVNT